MKLAVSLLLSLSVLAPGCGEVAQPVGGGPRVCAESYALAYFAERIGGTEVDVVHPCDRKEAVLLSAGPFSDFSLAVKQAREVKDLLMRLVPDQAELLALNHDLLERELQEFDGRMKRVGRTLADQPYIVSSDVVFEMARTYHLNVRSARWKPGKNPTEAEWDMLWDLLKKHPAQHMILETAPSSETLARLESAGLRCLVFDPCTEIPQGHGWKATMEANVKALEQVAQH